MRRAGMTTTLIRSIEETAVPKAIGRQSDLSRVRKPKDRRLNVWALVMMRHLGTGEELSLPFLGKDSPASDWAVNGSLGTARYEIGKTTTEPRKRLRLMTLDIQRNSV